MKVNMKKVSQKRALPLVVTHGIKPDHAIPLVTHIDRCPSVNIGWMELHFGWDEKWSAVVYAVTKKDTFLLAAASALPPGLTGSPKVCDWVYAIDGLPDGFVDHAKTPTALKYDGFYVEYGVDSAAREFLWILMPNAELQMLFRNPESPMTQCWSPRRAIPFMDSMVIGPFAGARQLQWARDRGEMIDDELEELLNGSS